VICHVTELNSKDRCAGRLKLNKQLSFAWALDLENDHPAEARLISRKEINLLMHYLLFYEVGEDYVTRRAEFRSAHLELAWAASERGELLLGGALADPIDTSLLLFKADSPAVAENFALVDPYVTSGIVKRWRVRQWNTVAGEGCANPVRPVTPVS
jgi:hypothetical protein